MKETKEEFKTELDELKEAIPIDINSLHLNAQEQPELAYRAGKLAAEAKAEARRKQILLDESKAIADREVRLEPSKFGLSKVTEGAVASAVLLHPTVAEANKLKLEVDIFADITQSLREAYQHRKSMLNLEGELYVSNYFGSECRQDCVCLREKYWEANIIYGTTGGIKISPKEV